MAFSDQAFLFAFLPLALLIISLCQAAPALRNLAIATASLIFIYWGSGAAVLIFLFNLLANYGFALLIGRRNKLVLAAGLAANLLPLFWFKYLGFAARTLSPALPDSWVVAVAAVVLPIGISFYTFQGISYLVDVYRGEIAPERNLIRFAAYHAFFPQVIAGPIVRYKDVAADFRRTALTLDMFAGGATRFAFGLIKKTIIADQVGAIADAAFNAAPGAFEIKGAWLGAIAYTIQIYFDFSAYSDMAIGLALMCGVRFIENFNHPYAAHTISEFWRRWHMSLSSWIRDYVYIPLGGNRRGSRRTLVNLGASFLATGLWHGAEWTFVLWGAWHGAFLILERLILRDRSHSLNSGAMRYFYALPVVIVGWVLFRSANLTQFLQYLRGMVEVTSLTRALPPDLAITLSGRGGIVLILSIVLVLAQGRYKPVGPTLAESQQTIGRAWARAGIFAICSVAGLLTVIPQHFSPFLYFRF